MVLVRIPDIDDNGNFTDTAVAARIREKATRNWVSASHRAKMATLGGLTNGTDTGAMTRVSQAAPYRMTEIALGYANVVSMGSREVAGPNPITVRCAVEYNGVFYPLYLRGSRDAVIAPGGYAEFEPVFVDVPKGATYYVRTLVTVDAGGKWPYGVYTGAAYLGDGVEQGTGITDKTTTGVVTGSNNYAYGPASIRALRIDGTSDVAAVGDSIAYGLGDSIDRGTIVRSLDGKLPLRNLGYPGAQASDFIGRYAGLRLRLARGASHWIVMFGTNDISAGKSAQQVKDDLLAVYRLGETLGVRVWAGTIPPRTTSTDSWVSTGNQTKAATEAVRVEVNDWVRTIPSPLAGVFDTADGWETSRNSGIWKPGITGDGVHPNGNGADAGAAMIDTTRLS
jgi:lysophospholipase L1-like esterase